LVTLAKINIARLDKLIVFQKEAEGAFIE